MPPLRERDDDVLLLAEQFLRQFGAKYGKDVREISPRARESLLSYPWPGNVRELSHVIERAVLWSRGPVLDADHLSLTEPAAIETAIARVDAVPPGPNAARRLAARRLAGPAFPPALAISPNGRKR